MAYGHRPMDSSFLPLLFLFLSSILAGAQDITSDRAALLAFREAVGSSRMPRWNISASPCSWTGVKCSGGRVTEFRVPGNSLSGEIPSGTIGNLTALRVISLRFNYLTGTLPLDLASCTELRGVHLEKNRLSGEIPRVIFELKQLVRLNLAGNLLSGGIPTELGSLGQLRTLYLEYNQLNGSIPDINFPSSLASFNVSFNPLNGSIPAGLRRFPNSSFLGTSLCGEPLSLCPHEISPAPPPTNSPTTSKSKISAGGIAGIVIGSVIVFLILLAFIFPIFHRRRERRDKAQYSKAVPQMGSPSNDVVPPPLPQQRVSAAMRPAPPVVTTTMGTSSSGKKLVFFGSEPRVYDLEALLRASAEVLGKGTFGTAYKAMLEMGVAVVVKRLKDVNIPEKEFKERAAAIGAVNHPNVVPLQAYYYSRDEKLLVYDLVDKGSLSSLLHGNRGVGRTPLDWNTRYNIALAAARGLEHIHSVGPDFSHGNIKSSNILLAQSYVARVSDHGLAYLAGPASQPQRTYGYRAPEVVDVRKVSQKADVYSFGVLLLEILTGKAPQHSVVNDDAVDLPRWAESVVSEGRTPEVFDAGLESLQNYLQEMSRLLQIAMECTTSFPDSRPSMDKIVVRIEQIRGSTTTA
ncbi:probable inactive receptor kinase At1g48480 [Typha latifolia]|uniref:probable inactive receptor kinase At1g48480 n=1 Tax=Typha latifolia TaxID=4733 RepID=UPI003C2CFBEC